MRRLIALLAAVSLLLAAQPTHAGPEDPRDAYERVKEQLAKAGTAAEGATARAAEATAQFQAASAALPAAESRVAEARGAVTAAKVQVATANRAVDEARRELAKADSAYAQAAGQVDAARHKLGDFASAAYQGSALAELNSLLSARGPTEFASRLGYMQRIAENQRDAINQTIKARLAAKVASNEATLARDRSERALAEAQRRAEAAKAAEKEAAAAAAALADLVAKRKAAAAIAEEEREATMARYDQLKAESERVEAALREWEWQQNPGGPVMRPGARLLMPVRGLKTSDYGMRFDPYYHVWQLHAGTDLAAPGGTPIHAADYGVVAYAGWLGGYGNYTCVRHGTYRGKGMSTCYAHQSQIGVDVGQRVRRGQLIGRVGSTGASTGDHLHFEVRLDGSPVQPLNWLPGCLC